VQLLLFCFCFIGIFLALSYIKCDLQVKHFCEIMGLRVANQELEAAYECTVAAAAVVVVIVVIVVVIVATVAAAVTVVIIMTIEIYL